MSSMRHVEILRAACCVAGQDGTISEQESTLLIRLADKSGVGQMSLNAMIDRAKQDPRFYREQFEVLTADPEKTVRVLLTIAAADGEISDGEQTVLAHVAERLGMSDERFAQLLAEWRQKLQRGDGGA